MGAEAVAFQPGIETPGNAVPWHELGSPGSTPSTESDLSLWPSRGRAPRGRFLLSVCVTLPKSCYENKRWTTSLLKTLLVHSVVLKTRSRRPSAWAVLPGELCGISAPHVSLSKCVTLPQGLAWIPTWPRGRQQNPLFAQTSLGAGAEGSSQAQSSPGFSGSLVQPRWPSAPNLAMPPKVLM